MKNIDIAKELNISPAAVSLALNNKPGVSEETRKKVFELKEISLQRDMEKRKIFKNKRLLGILCYETGYSVLEEHPFFASVLSRLSIATDENGYHLSILFSKSRTLMEQVGEINQSGFSGIFVMASQFTYEDVKILREYLNVPVVLIDASFSEKGIDCVLTDNQSGMRQMLEYAVEMGHRHIGFIGSDFYCANFRDRKKYFKMFLEEFSLPYEEKFNYSLRMDIEAAQVDMREILEKSEKLPTLLVASNDILAIGAMNALKDAGYQIPDDISIMGYDDLPFSRYTSPPLTTVYTDSKELVDNAMRLLLKKIQNEDQNPAFTTVLVNTELVKRGSVGKNIS